MDEVGRTSGEEVERRLLAFTIPGKVESTANLREHWGAKSKRISAQRTKARLLCPAWRGEPRVIITLTRFGSGPELDDDNLRSSLKGHRDGIATRLKIDDGSRLIRWEYFQERCKKGEERIEVEIR